MPKNSLKHIITILLISSCIFIPYLLITLPIAGVFIIDDATTSSELLFAYLRLLSISFAITIFVISPLNLLFDHLSKTKKYSIG